MSLTKWRKEDDLFPSFSSFFDDFFGRDFMNSVATGTSVPAVNISEEDDRFEVEVAAPGLRKEDFNINLDNKVLTISAERKEEKEEKDRKKITRKEFSFTSFRRAFTLPESVEADKIQASYKDGVLTLTLPKKEETKRLSPKKINID